MYDFQNIEIGQSHWKLARCGFKPCMGRLSVAKQTIQLRGTIQERLDSKDCIGWHDHVGCYAKEKNNKKPKLYDFLDIYESQEIL